MHISTDALISLLHEESFGTLATHSVQMPGYPFATALPFVPDARHRPVFLMSRLAEHARNLMADGRASLLVFKPERGDVQTGSRLTLVGAVARFAPSAALVARYLRYRPEAERYLALGDFEFFRLEPLRLRMIAGFGQMGWLDGKTLTEAEPLDEADEARFLPGIAGALPAGMRLLGIDRYGLDLERDGRRERALFPAAPVAVEHLAGALRAAIGVAE
jgi:hypothetical protein